ncbi:poly-gamma-glutamate synthesis protein (capsule biosynthesis protein) [Saccharothrix ecbatanensis]|uniref:Poly-gamma-glutamate synthesis protein (Capsule biosynthesis protein) n=1 Tax=Saccharothrix ecbatanensis TaxID=1105145 RepID=A0A7W9M1A3_9PSEU|nr:CapA family protein [Saccharothrix ecbatanensis]MBB5803653.1 poly-gamma-glutamate synthesis protein (capsule biosynthesis protein) [Saccharothrix ecbatanensis]
MPSVTLFLCGDVMTGRGVDQVLPCPGDPRLWERGVRDAVRYVGLAEEVSGPIPRPVGFAWPWGEAVGELDDVDPDVRVINLETSITRSDDVDGDKVVHYRMAPENIGCLTVVRPDVCALANNHVLDFGRRGLADTLDALATAGIASTGAGRNLGEAVTPAIVPAGPSRVVVFSYGHWSSGVPLRWGATFERPGVALLPDLSDATADWVVDRVRRVKQPGDVVVVSLHWGSNWGYDIPADQVRFGRRLLDGGVDILHGHSSHHPRRIEVHHGKLALYGCGDLVNDYEGIGGYEEYRDDLRPLYFPTVDADTGDLVDLRITPMRADRLSLRRASVEDAEHLRRVFGSATHLARDGSLRLRL